MDKVLVRGHDFHSGSALIMRWGPCELVWRPGLVWTQTRFVLRGRRVVADRERLARTKRRARPGPRPCEPPAGIAVAVRGSGPAATPSSRAGLDGTTRPGHSRLSESRPRPG